MKKETFTIRGMSCASCAMAIERALLKVEGVSSAVVNFASEEAFIEYYPEKIDISKIKKVIKETGYDYLEEKEVEKSERRGKNN